ncbi:MAG TPA: GNAT family N-acetyltransferase [Candidatus Cryosericum sp.]|nr:GNAT family N-acetyltransferase [Candidatus Cryosericum sp.]
MNGTVTFRRVLPEEVPALVRLRLATREETYRGIYPDEWIDGFDFAASEARFRDMTADPDQNVFFIKVNGETAGYLCYGREQEETMPKDSVCINMLYVLSAFQRRGIGALALEQVRKYCRSIGRKRFYNGCNLYNVKAIRFYQKNGGHVISWSTVSGNKAKDQVVFEHLVPPPAETIKP